MGWTRRNPLSESSHVHNADNELANAEVTHVQDCQDRLVFLLLTYECVYLYINYSFILMILLNAPGRAGAGAAGQASRGAAAAAAAATVVLYS